MTKMQIVQTFILYMRRGCGWWDWATCAHEIMQRSGQ
jgi:hypothetical protein